MRILISGILVFIKGGGFTINERIEKNPYSLFWIPRFLAVSSFSSVSSQQINKVKILEFLPSV